MTRVNRAQDCKYFSGYKPCNKGEECSPRCASYSKTVGQILIVHLEALGAVLRATSILPAVRRKYPQHQINWVTKSSARPLLENNPYIDRIFTLQHEDLLRLGTLEFDEALIIDKSALAFGVTKNLKIKSMKGFGIEARTGAIVPMNRAADELYQLGLDNHKKFVVNQKPETQLMIEALELGKYQEDEYVLALTDQEIRESKKRRELWRDGDDLVIGINVGCSQVIPYKKLGVNQHIKLVNKLQSQQPNATIVLLGGSEDWLMSQEIAQACGGRVVLSDHSGGLRDGMVSMRACDIIVSGDSLGMHMGIALKKWVVAWFGPTCAQEIELYGRGEKVLSDATCGPCWKRSCQKEVMCYDLVSIDKLCIAVEQGIQWQMSLSKQHSLEMSY